MVLAATLRNNFGGYLASMAPARIRNDCTGKNGIHGWEVMGAIEDGDEDEDGDGSGGDADWDTMERDGKGIWRG
jgi:hypothetical protein